MGAKQNIQKWFQNRLPRENQLLLQENKSLKEKLKNIGQEHNQMNDSLINNMALSDLGNYAKERVTIENILEFNHELITPLNLAVNYVNDFLKEEPGNKEISYTKSILDKTISLISNSLEEERLNVGIKIYDHKQISNISNIIQGITDIYEKAIVKNNVKLTTDIKKGLLVRAAPEAIEKVFTNLLENAIKYTPEGGEITINLNSDNKKINFFIKDTGPGIPEKELKYIFIPFYRVKTDERGNSYGLGLSLAKKLVDDMKGSISVESSLNGGAKFIVGFDACKPGPAEKESEYNYTSDMLPDKYNQIEDVVVPAHREALLIVDNNISLLQFFKDKLEGSYNLYFAQNGKRALKKLDEIPVIPDLIISDIIMDEMDGIKFKQVLNVREEYKCIPFIFLSVKSFFKNKLEGLELGSIDYVYKPFVWPELQSKIEAVIVNFKAQKENLLRNVGKQKLTDENYRQHKKDMFVSNCVKYNLTPQEKKVIEHLLQMNSTKDIADKLCVTKNTAGTHIANIYNKLGVSSRLEAMHMMYN